MHPQERSLRRLAPAAGLVLAGGLALVLPAGAQTGGLANAAAMRARQRLAAQRVERRAAAGDVKAELRLALLYYYGIGVPRDSARVLRWYRQAARQNSAEAELRLGDLYRYGLLVSPDPQAAAAHYARALALLRQRAHHGPRHRNQYLLGMMALLGRGRKPDPQQALRWFHLAARHENLHAELELGVLRTYGVAGIAANPARARYWFRRAARQGSATAAYTLAWLYRYGIGQPPDPAKADHWYRRALKLAP